MELTGLDPGAKDPSSNDIVALKSPLRPVELNAFSPDGYLFIVTNHMNANQKCPLSCDPSDDSA